MSTKERREREKRQRREIIISATVELLKQEGIAGVSMDKIAEKAELSKGTLYLYFKNKEQLLSEIFWMRLNILIDKLQTIMESEGEFDELVKQVIQTVMDYFTENVDIFRFIYHSLPSSAYDFMKQIHQTVEDFKLRIQEMSNKFYRRFDKGQFYIKTEYLQTVLRGLIWGFLTEKFFGQSEIELDTDLIYRIFSRGVLK